jgi:hypothetical protein
MLRVGESGVILGGFLKAHYLDEMLYVCKQHVIAINQATNTMKSKKLF